MAQEYGLNQCGVQKGVVLLAPKLLMSMTSTNTLVKHPTKSRVVPVENSTFQTGQGLLIWIFTKFPVHLRCPAWVGTQFSHLLLFIFAFHHHLNLLLKSPSSMRRVD